MKQLGWLLIGWLLLTLPLNAGAQSVMLTSNTNIWATNTTYEGYDVVVSNCTVALFGDHTFRAFSVISNGTASLTGTELCLTHLTLNEDSTFSVCGGGTLYVSNSIVLTNGSTVALQGTNTTAEVDGAWRGQGAVILTSNLTVAAGCAVSADGQGYAGGTGSQDGKGPGGGTGAAPFDAGGAGYGGKGGSQNVNAPPGDVYGSSIAPTDVGSGGGAASGDGYPGGGAVRVHASGRLRLDGTISADGGGGAAGYGGAGSGGSVYVTALELAGTGHFSAVGGEKTGGNGGGDGGGGRIAVYYGTATQFTGFLASTAAGGTNGSEGTVGFFQVEDLDGHLDDTGRVLYVCRTFTFEGDDAGVRLRGMVIGKDNTNGAALYLCPGTTLYASDSVLVTNTSTVICPGTNTDARVQYVWRGRGATLHVR